MKKTFALVLLLVGAAAHGGSAQQLKLADKLEIGELVSRWNLATDDKNLPAFLALWADNAEFANPFGTFKGKAALTGYFTQYTTTFSPGKRHYGSNLLVEDAGNGQARLTTDVLVMEAREIPYIVANVRATGTAVHTATGWKLQGMKLALDEGFQKLMAKAQGK